MSLFQIRKGPSSRLQQQEFRDGCVYLTPDDGGLYIDADDNGTQKRIRIDASDISSLTNADIDTIIAL